VLEACPDATFAIAGDGPSRRALVRRAAQLVGPRAVFLGWVEDLKALYGAMDVVVLTSRLEGTPLALMEAGAAAVPVVGTRVGGVPDVIVHGETGALVDAGDDGAVAREIVALLDDPARARRMGERAATRIRIRFSAQAMADGVEEIYRRLVERRLRPSRVRAR
jgi:glycosyltransferase involved in cell wall biosynthesis